jgi:hypothetical protein
MLLGSTLSTRRLWTHHREWRHGFNWYWQRGHSRWTVRICVRGAWRLAGNKQIGVLRISAIFLFR